MFLFFLLYFAYLQRSKLELVFVFKISWFFCNFIKLNKRTVLISWVHYCYIMSSALCRFFPDRYENKVPGLERSRQQVTVKEHKENRLQSCSFVKWHSIILSVSAHFLLVAICCSEQFWELPRVPCLKKKKSLVLDFKSYILCKLKWSCLHRDIKSLHKHVGVKYLSSEKPKSTLLTMKCCVIRLCLLTAGKKSLWLVTQSFFNGTKGHTQTVLLLWNQRGAPVCVLLPMLCFDPAMEDRGESAMAAAPLCPAWALVTRLKLALVYICLCIVLLSLLGWWGWP